ncbi:MAG: hypothetical protein Q9159_007146 [Coniocarpon cinnabarinum]
MFDPVGPPFIRQYSSIDGRAATSFTEATTPAEALPIVSGPDMKSTSHLGCDGPGKLQGAWHETLERILPPDLRREGSSKSLAYVDERKVLSDIIYQARNEADVDVLGHLGLVERRWDAVMWVVERLVEVQEPSRFFRDHRISTLARWPSDQTLEEATATSKAPESLFQDHPTEATAIADPNVSLNELTSVSQSSLQTRSDSHHRHILGAIWESLGHMIIVATSKKDEDSQVVMANVVRMIAQLHQRDYIPNKVFDEAVRQNDMSLTQPPFIQSLSNEIFMALIDTSVVIESRSGADSSVRNLPLRPELWLEFILWCCVHGGWLREGARIVSRLGSTNAGKKWHLINWYTGPEPLARDWSDTRASEMYVERADTNEELAEVSRMSHAISCEVVVALVDGLVTAATSRTLVGDVQQAHEAILSLKNVLGRSAMNLGVSSWDEIVARLAELPNMAVEENAALLEKILDLSETFGRENNAKNALDKPDKWSASSAYVFDGSAACIGLYHRLLATYIRERDTDSALRILARLQHFTDANKTNALRDFLNRLTRSKQRPKEVTTRSLSPEDVDPSNGLAKMRYPSFFPSIPSPILASLLDLITESRAFDIGDWMVNSEDVDGPLIPNHLYSDQALAPALIRFAAEAKDSKLLKELRRSQTVQVSGKTLVALLESHITSQSWKRAADILSTIHTYNLHDWGEPDLARVTGAFLRHLSSTKEHGPSLEGLRLLLDILSGRLGDIWKTSSHRDSVVAVLSTMNTNLAEYLEDLLHVTQMSSLDLTTESFEVLLNSATQAFGSPVGRLLWEIWCQEELSARQVREPDRSTVVNIPISRRAESFSAGQDQVGPTRSPPLAPSITGHVEATISTLRLIVQKALSEYRQAEIDEDQTTAFEKNQQSQPGQKANTAAEAAEVLDWAATIFAQRFGLRKVDIEEELEDFSTPAHKDTKRSSLYHKSTMRIWQAVYEASPTWTMTAESKMRVFATASKVDQIQFDPADSAGRRFLHCLAEDFSLISESFGDEEDRHVSAFKTANTPRVPSITVAEAVRRVKKHSLSEAG